MSKGKGKADGGKENKTNWDGIELVELGQTKDWRYSFQLCYQLILITCTQTMDQEIQLMECEWNQSVDKGFVSSVHNY